MSDAVPILPTLADPPRRDRQIVATAVLSVLLHLLLLGWILLPRVHLPEPAEPQSVNVDLVPPSELSSLKPPISSQAPSSLPPPASSDAAASSAEPPSSAEAASAEAPSSAAASSEAPPSSTTASSEASSAAPTPQARPVVIPVGPSEASSDPASALDDASASESEQSSEASDAASSDASGASAPDTESSVLTVDAPDASGDLEQPSTEPAGTPADGPPLPAGALHAAKRFYLADMLQAPAMAAARKALKTLPPEKRLAQTCNIEALGQIGNAGKGYEPDALVASAFAKPIITGNTYSVSNGAFRSKQKWVAVAYDCTLSKKLDAVASFTFRLGSEVTDEMEARFGAKRPGG